MSAPAKIGGVCPNCHSLLLGPYCSNCGQPVHSYHRSLGHLIGDFLKDVASFDSRMWRTAVALLMKPGELTAAFREGRTQRYVPAVRLFFFLLLIFFFVLSVSHIAFVQIGMHTDRYPVQHAASGAAFYVTDAGKKHALHGHEAAQKYVFRGLGLAMPVFFAPEGAVKPLSAEAQQALIARIEHGEAGTKTVAAIRQRFIGLLKNPALASKWVSEWIPKAMLFLLPVFALLLFWLHHRRRRDYYFVDHVAFALNLHSFAFVLLVVVAGLKQIIPSGYVLWLIPAGLAWYLIAGMKHFYAQGWALTVAKSVALTAGYAFFLFLASIGVFITGVIYG